MIFTDFATASEERHPAGIELCAAKALLGNVNKKTQGTRSEGSKNNNGFVWTLGGAPRAVIMKKATWINDQARLYLEPSLGNGYTLGKSIKLVVSFQSPISLVTTLGTAIGTVQLIAEEKIHQLHCASHVLVALIDRHSPVGKKLKSKLLNGEVRSFTTSELVDEWDIQPSILRDYQEADAFYIYRYIVEKLTQQKTDTFILSAANQRSALELMRDIG